MTTNSRMRSFDPRKVAQYEVANYVAYYQKDWAKLLRCTVGLVKEAFGLSLPQAIQGAALVVRAEVAFAPFPDNDVPKAEATMTQFYRLLKRAHPGEVFDEAQAARLDVQWWLVHRELFANADNQQLTDALADLWAYTYDVPRNAVLDAACHRAQGMLISDLWVNAGKYPASPMLRDEEEELFASYALLRKAVAMDMTTQPVRLHTEYGQPDR